MTECYDVHMELFPAIQELLLWSGALSLAAVLAAIVGAPWVLSRLPADYFARDRRTGWRNRPGRSVLARVATLVKNALGGLLVLLGIILLLMPGQGILTILAGLLLMNFPGKYRLERWLVMRRGVMTSLNWLRKRQGEPPFDSPQESLPK